MILGEIRRYVRDNASIRVSRSLKDLAYKANKLQDELSISFGRSPSIKEISKELGVDEYLVVEALDSRKDPVSIFEPIYSDGGDTIYLFDQIEDKKNKIEIETQLTIKNALKKLSQREQYILDQRYLIGKTQMELSEELGISQAQISRIEKNSIETLRKNIE